MRIFIALCFLLSGCSLLGKKKIAEPKLHLEDVQLANASLDGARLEFIIKVDNPNAFPLELDSVHYDLEFEGKPVGKGEVTKNLKVEKNSSTLIRLPVNVQLKNFFKSAASLIGKGTTPYHLKGAAKYGLLKLPFEESGDLRYEDGKVKREKKKKD